MTTPEGRAGRLGAELDCVRCDEMGLKVAEAILIECKKSLTENYESAGMSGLCEEGRWEAAVGSLSTIDLRKIITKTLGTK